VNGTLVTSGSNSKIIPLTFGDNTITVEVTAQDGITTSTYRVAVRRISDVSTLSALTLSSGTLSPDFSPNTTSYTASVANATTSITVTPTVTNSFATVRVNSMLVTSGSASQSIPLKVGSNTITILGTDEGGNNTSYTITLIRISNVSTLSDLSLIGGTLSPVFESSTTSYRASVRGEYSSITVRPTLTTTTATVRVNGTLVTSGSNSKIIPLTFGDNTITVEVTAQDGTTMTTYTLTVTRLSNVSTLSSLTLSSGTLSPDFTSNFTLYTAIVADTGSITVKPTGTDPFALIRVNGVQVTSGSASQSIPLALGSNTITVAVTAQDGSNTITYTVAVTRLRLTDSTLSGLMLSSGTLSPGFASSTTSYTASVANATTSITVRPTLATTTATVRVNGTLVTSGNNSQSIPLTVGSNAITILGTAEDGVTTTSYSVTVTRALSAVSTLSALTLSSGTLSPGFASGTRNYIASVTNATTSITVRPTVTDATATIIVNGTTVASGSNSQAVPLEVGPNTITVVGTAQDGTSTSTYTLVVTRKSATSSLSGLVLSSGTLSPAFGSSTTSYTTSIAQGVESLTVTPTGTDSNASVKVNGVTVASGSASGQIPLGLEATTVTSVVTAEDPAFTTSYTVTVGERVLSSPAALVTTSESYTATGNAVNIRLGFAPATGTSLVLVNHTGIGLISGEFQNLRHGQELVLPYEGKEYRYVVDYYGGTGNDLVLQWADNGLIGWGKNAQGQLGIGSLADQSVPTDLVASGLLSGKKVASVAAGESHTLALSDEGMLTAWGLNASGQLGTNNTANSQLPVAVVRPAFLDGKQIIAVAAGNHFSLALCADGTLASWGDNSVGQLGDGSAKVNSIEPLDITGKGALAGRTVVAIRAGARHALALCSDGRVVAWGANESGQHGNGTTQGSNLPVLVSANGALLGKTVQSISAGGKHSLALFTDGGIAAWGANSSGQLGNNSTVSSNVPVTVPKQGAISGKTVIGLSAGGDHSLAVCSDGTVAAWGLNSSGQLGNSSNNTSFVPVPVTMNTGALLSKRVIAVSASAAHSVALCSDETTVAWGANASGSLGNNSNTSSNIAVAVTRSGVLSSKKVSAVATGGAQSFALCSDGTLTSWGLNTFGQLGNNTTETTRVPVTVTTTTGALFGKTVVATSVGQSHTVVRFSNGGMAAWGRNAEGQLGNNTTTNSNIPVEVFSGGVLSGKKIAAVSAGAAHNVALCSDGTVVTWGSNSSGQLGTGTAIVSSLIPTNITGLGALSGKTVVAVSAGTNHSLALCSDGRVVAWGRGTSGQLGTGSTSSSSLPVAVSWTGVMAGKTVVSIAAGADHNLSLCSDGTLVAWGRNDFGQIGNNLAGNLITPGRVETTSGALMGKTVVSLAAGTNHSLVLCSDGTLAAWGSNAQGQLGTIGSNGSFVPIAVARNIGALFGKTVTKIGCGEFHSMALSSDGDLASWGEGVSGQLGNNTLISSDIPESVTTAGALSSKSVWNIASGGASSFVIAALPASTLPAALYDLALAEAELTPGFDSAITSYQASVPNEVTSVTLEAVAENPTAQLKINGVSAGFDRATESILLSEGSNLISVEVIAEDGLSSAFYTVTVTRELSTISSLSGLTLSVGNLNPSFASEITEYSASVPNGTTGITVRPTLSSPLANVRVNGTSVNSGSDSQSIPLTVGDNTITIEVTAQDGSKAITTLTVIRDGSSYANWQDDVFTPEEQADPSMSGEQASPAGDGISNLMKYALKLDPKSSDVANLPASSARDGHLTLTFRRNKRAADLTFTVQVASDLTSDVWEDVDVVISQTDEGEYWLVTVRDDEPMHNHSKRFMRLKVSK
jgi:alpha-tubulin suppressor-like RCC1 family protein/tRNA threonylcarbamoyladenosine modification (KEOPS) complex  Pcc1 subunit